MCALFISKLFFTDSDFSTITPYLFNPISKVFGNFLLKLSTADHRHRFVSDFGPEAKVQIN